MACVCGDCDEYYFVAEQPPAPTKKRTGETQSAEKVKACKQVNDLSPLVFVRNLKTLLLKMNPIKPLSLEDQQKVTKRVKATGVKNRKPRS